MTRREAHDRYIAAVAPARARLEAAVAPHLKRLVEAAAPWANNRMICDDLVYPSARRYAWLGSLRNQETLTAITAYDAAVKPLYRSYADETATEYARYLENLRTAFPGRSEERAA